MYIVIKTDGIKLISQSELYVQFVVHVATSVYLEAQLRFSNTVECRYNAV